MIFLLVFGCCATSLALGVVYLCLRADSRDDYQRGYEAGRRDGWNAAMSERLEAWDVEHRESTHRADL